MDQDVKQTVSNGILDELLPRGLTIWHPGVFTSQHVNSPANIAFAASGAVHRGTPDLAAQQCVAFIVWQRLQIERDRFANIRHGILEVWPVRVAAFQFGTPGVKAVLVFFNNAAGLANDKFLLTASRRAVSSDQQFISKETRASPCNCRAAIKRISVHR